jgi:cytochrome P450
MKVTPVNALYVSLAEAAIFIYVFPSVIPFGTLSGALMLFSGINFGILLFYKLIVYPFFLSPLRHLPGSNKGFILILGRVGIMFERPPGGAHLRMIKETPNEGIIHFRGFLHSDRLILTSPAAFADVLVHKSYDFEKPPWVRKFLEQFLGHGLLMAEGAEHKHQRKQIMPAFHFRHIKELYPVFWTKSVELCEVVKAELWDQPNKVLEVNHFSTQVTMDIIGLAGLGRDIGALRTSDDELVKNYEEILEPTVEKGVYFVLHLMLPPWMIKASIPTQIRQFLVFVLTVRQALPWKLNERVRITASNLKRICTEFVQEKKSKMKLESEESVDILSIMIRSNNFSDEGLVDQLLTFLAAGYVPILFYPPVTQ